MTKRQIDGFAKAFSDRGAEIGFLPGDGFSVGTKDGEIADGLGKCDFVLYLNKDPAQALALEKSGYKLFNSSKTIYYCEDKSLTYTVLSGEGVPLIDTIFAPMRYYGGDGEDYLKEVSDGLGFPLVVKRCKGSLGEGVYLARDFEELKTVSGGIGAEAHLFQKFYGKGGEDIRLIVIGGKTVAAMKRVNLRDFRANIALGGKGERYEPTEEEREIAEKCARTVGADYCGVDLIPGKDGPKVSEINSNAFFFEATKVSGVDVAGAYAEYILNKITNFT